jgi:N-acetylneuraminic acid mutarotase
MTESRLRAALCVLAPALPRDVHAARMRVLAFALFATTLAGLGTWQRLPTAPIAPNTALTSVWTGKEMLVFGRQERRAEDGAVLERANVAAAYDPGTKTWRRLPSPGPTGSFLRYSAVWTGKEMLVWGQGTREAFDPRTNRWRSLPGSRLLAIHDGYGLVAWTGRELIGWGGGCCGDAFSDGVAYSPATNKWRALARSPLAGSQHPVGVWTGRELVVFVGGVDPDGHRWPARLARAAAYDPRTNSWRRIAAAPSELGNAVAVWDGREVLAGGLAYDPATNRWRRLASAPVPGAAPVWTGTRLVDWASGRAYDPKADRWTRIAAAPLARRGESTATWTGRALIVWTGTKGATFRP